MTRAAAKGHSTQNGACAERGAVEHQADGPHAWRAAEQLKTRLSTINLKRTTATGCSRAWSAAEQYETGVPPGP